MLNTKLQNHGAEYKIRVKSGDLAAPGKGTMTIMPTTDGQFSVDVLLPGETSVLNPLDLTTVERVALVGRKIGWFGKSQWVRPVVTTAGAFIGVPIVVGGLVGAGQGAALLFVGTWLGATYGAGVYTGTRLTRLARFVVTTEDGKHAVLEGPENAFCFLDGVYTAPNIQLKEVASEAPEVPAAEPAAAAAAAPA